MNEQQATVTIKLSYQFP